MNRHVEDRRQDAGFRGYGPERQDSEQQGVAREEDDHIFLSEGQYERVYCGGMQSA